MKPQILIPVVIALALSAGARTPSAPAAGCRHAEAVFYTTDSQRLAQRLAANQSPCTDYYISVTPGGDATIPLTPVLLINPRAIAAAIRGNGPQFHAMAEVRPSEWGRWVAYTGKSWFDAGVETRRRMANAGYDVGKGDTWAVNELGPDVLGDTPGARANLSGYLRGLYTGDGTPAKGLVFAAEPLHTAAAADLGSYRDQLQQFFGDTAFWTGMSQHVRFWGQETYADARAWGVSGTDQATRRAHLDPYLEHALTLADAGPGSVDAARSFLDAAYTPIGNAAWPQTSGFGWTSIPAATMNAFIASQTDAFRQWPNDRFGFAWVPKTPGIAASVFVDMLDHLATAIHNSDTDPAGACASSACAGDVDGAAFNDAWNLFGAWSPPTNTPEGANVTVTPAPGTSVTFESVTSRGSTQTAPAGINFPFPAGYSVVPVSIPQAITTTAVYNGVVQVCLEYDSTAFVGDTPRLLEEDGGAWRDITAEHDSTRLCGIAGQLSTFVVAGAAWPTITVPDPIVVDGVDAAGAVVTYDVAATSPYDPSPTVDCEPRSGSAFPYGTTTVDCVAVDDEQGRSEATFVVTVRDVLPPVLSVPSTLTVDATGPGGATVTWSATAVDYADPSPTVSCTPAAGATFPIGRSTVTCSATDASGNTATASFDVVVLGASDQLHELTLATTAAGLADGMRTALLAKLDSALAHLGDGKACVHLAAYAKLLGNVVRADVAAPLQADVTRIEAVLGC